MVGVLTGGAVRAEPIAHVEFKLSILAGMRSYDRANFSAEQVREDVADEISDASFDRTTVAGAGAEFHVVVYDVRLGIGIDRPYTLVSEGSVTTDEGRNLDVRGLDTREIRYSVGFQHDFGKVTAITDLIGTADQLSLNTESGDAQTTYESDNFGFSLRVGAHIPVFNRRLFGHAAVELGLESNVDASLYVGAGVRIP